MGRLGIREILWIAVDNPPTYRLDSTTGEHEQPELEEEPGGGAAKRRGGNDASELGSSEDHQAVGDPGSRRPAARKKTTVRTR